MHINGKAFRTIWFDEKDQAVKIINQTKLPHQFEIKKNDPANNCLDTAIITNPKLMTKKTKKKLKNIAGRVLFKK